jgi:hypothetical protein
VVMGREGIYSDERPHHHTFNDGKDSHRGIDIISSYLI